MLGCGFAGSLVLLLAIHPPQTRGCDRATGEDPSDDEAGAAASEKPTKDEDDAADHRCPRVDCFPGGWFMLVGYVARIRCIGMGLPVNLIPILGDSLTRGSLRLNRRLGIFNFIGLGLY